jgi:hypothetical protein
MVQALQGKKEDAISKITRVKKAGGMAQETCLASVKL